MTGMPLRIVWFLFFVHSVLPAPAPAGIPAIDFSGSGRLRDQEGLVGFAFETHRDITVTDLGKFDANGNGTLDDLIPPRVGLWDQIGQLQASATIDLLTAPDNGAFYAPVAPTTIPPGIYVVGVQMFADQEPYSSIPSTSVATSDSIDWNAGRRRTESDFKFPISSSRRTSYFGPNFRIDEPLALFGPMPRAVFQRDSSNMGLVKLDGVVSDPVDRIEARAVVMDGFTGVSTEWQTIDTVGSRITGAVSVPAGGWYRIETRAYDGDVLLAEDSVGQIGVGEVFVTAGQSNSANHGSPRTTPRSDLVSAMDGDGLWQHASDPQPVATGAGGSPWPALGDLLVEEYGVPVGFASVGWGGTRVGQWLPGASGPDSAPLYDRLESALDLLGRNGARAVLWHQGESDASSGISTERYADRLNEVIAKSREDAEYEIPWIVARVSYLPANSPRSMERVVAGQEQVIAQDPLVFAGPLTDDLLGSQWRWDQVHFNEAGLREHAARWEDAIRPVVVPEPSTCLLGLMALVGVSVILSRRRVLLGKGSYSY